MKCKLFLALSFTIILLTGITSCNDDDSVNPLAPVITLDSETSIYLVKAGKTLTIAPTYKYADNAIFVWRCNGKVIGRDKSLSYTSIETGDIYVDLDVINNVGTTYAEIKISVISLAIPEISLTIPENGYEIIKSSSLEITPTVTNLEGTTFSWSVNGTQVSTDKNYTFSSDQTGEYSLIFTATNEDGSKEITIPIKVCTAEDLPFSWVFEQTVYYMSSGRKIRLIAYDITNEFDAEYIWKINGEEKQKNENPWYIFSESTQGVYTVTVTMKNSYREVIQSLTVNVCPPEGTYRRTATSANNAQWNKVYGFLPAPGQFVNENYSASTMEEAITYAEGRLNSEAYVSLGGFGGYIIVGFDHSIANDGDYNIQIKGNSFAGSSEPGIVWVMQDENGDGLPNDTWYELKGCETDKGTTIQDYAVTYYKPEATGMSVQWTDNQGNNGMIDYLGFHTQDYYYPLWAESETITFRGTCLPASNRETSPGYWYNGEFDWGYVDNFSPVDRLTDNINYSAAANGNHFKISHAIDYNKNEVDLDYIDFVKISTGVNCKSGWLGEVSTEVFNVKDFNLLK